MTNEDIMRWKIDTTSEPDNLGAGWEDLMASDYLRFLVRTEAQGSRADHKQSRHRRHPRP